jgi:hypothetical protein
MFQLTSSIFPFLLFVLAYQCWEDRGKKEFLLHMHPPSVHQLNADILQAENVPERLLYKRKHDGEFGKMANQISLGEQLNRTTTSTTTRAKT